MELAECAQCGKLSMFYIDNEDFSRELQGRVTMMIANNVVYVAVTLLDSSIARLAQRFDHHRLTDELEKSITEELKFLEVALCPKCGDYCDVTLNFATSTIPLKFTKM